MVLDYHQHTRFGIFSVTELNVMGRIANLFCISILLREEIKFIHSGGDPDIPVGYIGTRNIKGIENVEHEASLMLLLQNTSTKPFPDIIMNILADSVVLKAKGKILVYQVLTSSIKESNLLRF